MVWSACQDTLSGRLGLVDCPLAPYPYRTGRVFHNATTRPGSMAMPVWNEKSLPDNCTTWANSCLSLAGGMEPFFPSVSALSVRKGARDMADCSQPSTPPRAGHIHKPPFLSSAGDGTLSVITASAGCHGSKSCTICPLRRLGEWRVLPCRQVVDVLT